MNHDSRKTSSTLLGLSIEEDSVEDGRSGPEATTVDLGDQILLQDDGEVSYCVVVTRVVSRRHLMNEKKASDSAWAKLFWRELGMHSDEEVMQSGLRGREGQT